MWPGWRYMYICNDLDHLEEVVESHNCVEEHEKGFGHLKDVFHFPGCSGLEVSNTVIAHIANRPSSEWR